MVTFKSIGVCGQDISFRRHFVYDYREKTFRALFRGVAALPAPRARAVLHVIRNNQWDRDCWGENGMGKKHIFIGIFNKAKKLLAHQHGASTFWNIHIFATNTFLLKNVVPVALSDKRIWFYLDIWRGVKMF